MLGGTLYAILYPNDWAKLVNQVQNDVEGVQQQLKTKHTQTPINAFINIILEEANGVNFERLFAKVEALREEFVAFRTSKGKDQEGTILKLGALLPTRKS
jgi:hypothetical protein